MIPRALRGKFFVEVFSGSGRLSLALIGQDIRAVTFDILDGPDGDLLRSCVRRHVYRLLRHKDCIGIWFGYPCGTFSRARRGKAGMPGALRGEEGRDLYGLPGLNEKDQLKVDVANQLLVYLLQLCKYAHRRRVPFYIENPLTSRLWKMPEMKQIMSLSHSDTVELDFCQYGEAWRKSTRLLVSRHPDLRSVGKRCCFGRGYVCSATGRRHQQLTGATKDESGKSLFWTAKAQAYPKRLVRSLASSIREHAIGRWMMGAGPS